MTLEKIRDELLQICDGSNWPEYAWSGDGYKAYSEITERLHEIVMDMFNSEQQPKNSK